MLMRNSGLLLLAAGWLAMPWLAAPAFAAAGAQPIKIGAIFSVTGSA